jgi:hypothetical protein
MMCFYKQMSSFKVTIFNLQNCVLPKQQGVTPVETLHAVVSLSFMFMSSFGNHFNRARAPHQTHVSMCHLVCGLWISSLICCVSTRMPHATDHHNPWRCAQRLAQDLLIHKTSYF